MRYGAPTSWRVHRVLLAERMGWSLEYVDALDMAEVVEILTVLGAKAAAMSYE